MAGQYGGMNLVLHNFKKSLADSHRYEDMPIWEQVYKKAFPDMIGFISYRKDGFWQREGIDRGVFLENTKQIFIDEKVRKRNAITKKVYPDIALEYLSSAEHKKPGWVCKSLRADYIAYLIAPLGICHLLPVIQMQNAWIRYGAEWIKKYPKISAKNEGYTTISVGIPVDILYRAMGQEFRIKFEPFEI